VLVVVTCQMCRKRSAHAPVADDSTADEQLRDGTLEIGVFFISALLVRILAFRAFFEQVSEHRAADAAALQYTASDHKANEVALAIARVVIVLLVAFLLVAAGALPDDVSEQGTTHASASQHTTRDQSAADLAIIVSALVARVLVAVVGRVLEVASFAQQLRLENLAQTPPPQQAAADQRLDELAVFIVSSAGLVAVLVVARVRVLVDQARDQRAANARVATYPLAGRESGEVVGLHGVDHVYSGVSSGRLR